MKLIILLFCAHVAHGGGNCEKDVYDKFFRFSKTLMTHDLFDNKIDAHEAFDKVAKNFKVMAENIDKCTDDAVTEKHPDCATLEELFDQDMKSTDCRSDEFDLIYNEVKDWIIINVQQGEFDDKLVTLDNYKKYAKAIAKAFGKLLAKCVKESFMGGASKECIAMSNVVKISDIMTFMPYMIE